MSFAQFIITYWKYILSALISGCFLVVNIIQAIRSHNGRKLNDAICRIPEFIRQAEEIANFIPWDKSTTTTTAKGAYKKATAESLIKNEVGEKFFNKFISVFDDAIEDILNTPQKKGGSDGVSKENEER